MKRPRRVCANCGKVEPKRLWLHPMRMFKIWEGASSEVDLCTFACESEYRNKQRARRR